MVILDTSVWIYFFRQDKGISSRLFELVGQRKIFAVESVFGELLYGARNNEEVNTILWYWDNLPKVKSEGLFIQAGLFIQHERLQNSGIGIIDAVILLAARTHQSQIWTFDKKMLKVLKPEEIYD